MRTLIEPIAGSSRALVFGMVWASAIGSNPEKQARARARKARAHFYTRGRTRSTVVGMLTLPRGQHKPGKKMDLYSAAAAFARAYDRGAVAVQLPLRDGGFWVSAAVDGVVQIGADVIHDTSDAAQQHLAQLRQTHPTLQVLGNDAADAKADAKLGEGVFLDNLAEAVRLQRTSMTLSDLPWTVWLAAGILVALPVWQAVRHHAEQQQALARASAQAQTVDPVAVWKDSLETWAQNQVMDGMAAVQAMMTSVARLPLTPGRWELGTVDCQPALCHALYRRTRLADNPGLQQALPPEWSIQWLDIDSARVSVPTKWVSSRRGELAAMPDDHAYVAEVLTRWQYVRPAMEDLRIGSKTAVALPVPLAPDSAGNPAPVPFPEKSGLIRPFLREVTVTAPLRTMAALAWPDQSQMLSLQVRRSSPTEVDLTHSALHATLKGIIYVQ